MRWERLLDCWPSVRGSIVLGSLFEGTRRGGAAAVTDKKEAQKVWICAGHVFVALPKRLVLVAFDVIPSALHLSEQTQQQFFKLVSQSLRDVVEAHPSTMVPDLLYSMHEDSPIIHVGCFPKTFLFALPSSFSLMADLKTTSSSFVPAMVWSGNNTEALSLEPSVLEGFDTLFVLRENGNVEIWLYCKELYHWCQLTVLSPFSASERNNKNGAAGARKFSNGTVTISEGGDIHVFYSETYSSTVDGEYRDVNVANATTLLCDIYTLRVPRHCLGVENSGLLAFAQPTPTKLLDSVLDMELYPIAHHGMLFMPKLLLETFLPKSSSASTSPSPSNSELLDIRATTNLCYFWTFQDQVLRSYVMDPMALTPSLDNDDNNNKSNNSNGNSSNNNNETRSLVATTSVFASSEAFFLSSALYPLTEDLLLLGKQGNLYNVTLENSDIVPQLKFKHLSKLQFPSELISFIQSRNATPHTRPFKMVPHRLNVFIFALSKLWIFSMRSGILREVHPYPLEGSTANYQVWWSNDVTNKIGLYDSQFIWQLQSPKIADTFPKTSELSLTKNADQLLDATYNANLWQLPHHHISYALAVAMNATQINQNTSDSVTHIALDSSRYLLSNNSLESPALPIALLNMYPSDRVAISNVVQKYLKVYQGEGEPIKIHDESASIFGKENEKTLSPSFQAFCSRTPLNNIITPYLKELARLLSFQNEAVATDNETDEGTNSSSIGLFDEFQHFLLIRDTEEELNEIVQRIFTLYYNPQKLDELRPVIVHDRARLEFLIDSNPNMVFECLESALRLNELVVADNIDSKYNTKLSVSDDELGIFYLLFQEESLQEAPYEGFYTRSSKHAMFEILCRLYLLEKPHLLCNLIHFSQSCHILYLNKTIPSKPGYPRHSKATQKDIQKIVKNFNRRAVKAILPTRPRDILKLKHPNEAIQVIIKLLCNIEQPSQAMRFCLSLNRWNVAIELVEKYQDKELEHAELFHVLLTTYLTDLFSPSAADSVDTAPTDKAVLNDIWRVMPRHYSVYDLLILLRSLDSSVSSPLLSQLDTTPALENNNNLSLFRDQLMKMCANMNTTNSK